MFEQDSVTFTETCRR